MNGSASEKFVFPPSPRSRSCCVSYSKFVKKTCGWVGNHPQTQLLSTIDRMENAPTHPPSGGTHDTSPAAWHGCQRAAIGWRGRTGRRGQLERIGHNNLEDREIQYLCGEMYEISGVKKSQRCQMPDAVTYYPSHWQWKCKSQSKRKKRLHPVFPASTTAPSGHYDLQPPVHLVAC